MGVHISTVWGKNVSFTNLTFLASLEIDKLLWRCLQSLAFFPGLTRVTTLEGINHTNCWLIFSHTLHKISQACTSSGGKGKKRNRLGQNVLHSSNKCRVSKTEQFLTRTLFTMVFMERDKECFDQPSLSSIFTISRNCLQFCVFSPKTLFKSLSWEIQKYLGNVKTIKGSRDLLQFLESTTAVLLLWLGMLAGHCIQDGTLVSVTKGSLIEAPEGEWHSRKSSITGPELSVRFWM